jgi:hypothetical protein
VKAGTAVQPGAGLGRWRAPGVRPLLAGLWIFDGLLNFQPQMFKQFSAMVTPMAAGQAAVVAYPITHVGNFLARDNALWTVVFGLVQIGIGVGLLRRRSLRAAVIVSFVFGLGVWWMGEGLGGIFNGTASPLTGAPGAVLVYLFLGAVVWREEEGRSARGLLLAGWTGYWALSALFWSFPQNRAAGAVSDQLSDAAGGEPGWYAHLLNWLAHAFSGAGTSVAVSMVALSILMAVGPWAGRRPGPFIAAGSVIAVVFSVTGQAVGGLLSGMASDPNIGPLVVLAGLALWRASRVEEAAVAPGERLLRLRPVATGLALGAMLLAPAAVSLVPASAATAGRAATSSGSGSGGSGSGASASGSGAGSGMNMSDMPGMTNSPGDTSSGSSGASVPMQNMEGAAGLGVTDPTWTYTGAALPPGEVGMLDLVGGQTDAGHEMQTPSCSTRPTAQQILGSMEYIQATTTAVAKYKVLATAVADGYRPITSLAYPVVHYVNPAYYSDRYAMDPNHVDSLVYAYTPNGPVLVAAMYLLTRPGADGPMPYGCLVQWHAHTNLCFSTTTGIIVGFAPCVSGTVNRITGMMTHVWQVPVPGGPLAIDPSDLEVVEAAVMAQDEGLAPTTAANGAVSYQSGADAKVGKF